MSKFTFEPKLRVNVYHNLDGKYYLESEEAVVDGNNKVMFKAPVPFAISHLKAFAELMIQKEKEETFPGIFPEDLLYMDKHSIAIYHKPQSRKLNFRSGLKIESKEYLIPGLIFILKNNGLSVFVYMGSKRPHDDTPLYRAPFYNMYMNGKICMGNNSIHQLKKIKNLYEAVNIAVTMFFQSEFSHYIEAERLKNITLEDLYRNRQGIIPKKAYIYEKQNLKEAIKSTQA